MIEAPSRVIEELLLERLKLVEKRFLSHHFGRESATTASGHILSL